MSNPSTNRRDFLKTAAAASTLAAVNAPLVHAQGSDTIKVGIIGCGGRGTGAGDNVLHSAPNVKIVALGDVFKPRAESCRNSLRKIGEQDGVKKLGNSVEITDDNVFHGLDCHEKVANSGANYIILASPPGFRPMHLEAAVRAGKNIFTEKPVSVDGPGTRKVLAAYEDALKKKIAIAAGTQRRHQASYLETMKRIHDGELGTITALRAYWNGNGIWFRPRSSLPGLGVKDSDLAYQMNNWYHFVWTCGDHICEQHVHNLDVCNWAMGNKHPVRCVGMGSRIARAQGKPEEVGNIFDNFAIDYEYEGGVHMLSMCRQIPNTVADVSEALAGSKGFCQFGSHTFRDLTGKQTWRYGGGGQDPYIQEHTDLIESIRKGTPINELKNVAESSLTAIMGRMSSYTGKAVTWDQALNSKDNTFQVNYSWEATLPVPPAATPGKTPLV
jgi:myo-inositol 2-dehydrogenase / D-chiro-inositol 1-dehydrogenase